MVPTRKSPSAVGSHDGVRPRLFVGPSSAACERSASLPNGARIARPEVLLVMRACHEECESILLGISQFQSEHGAWNVFIDDTGRADDDPEWVSSYRWDGVISRTTTAGLVEVCAARKIPLVDLHDGPVFAGIPKIRPDNRAIGHMGAEDLYERGYRHLYFCGYEGVRWSAERRDGFLEALLLLGCPGSEHAVPFTCNITPPSNAETVRQLAGWLSSLPKPAAIMAAHDQQASQLLTAAEVAGIRVPEEVAVVGVNNDRVRCGLSVPPLSSVATDTVRAGYLAAEELARRIRGEPGAIDELLLEPVKVVTRRSTDNLAVEDHAISRALGIIREKACEGISVCDVMRLASISRAKLENGFRRYLGRSPQAEIRRIQLNRIKQLLLETDLPLKQIALMTGYEHVEYLNVSFKRAVGETPGRFRRQVRRATTPGAEATAA